MPTSIISGRGQTVVPKAIRDKLALRPGDRIDYIVQDDDQTVLIRPAVEDVRALKGLLHRPGRPAVSVSAMRRAIARRAGRAA